MTNPRPESEQPHDRGEHTPPAWVTLWIDYTMAGFPVTMRLAAPTAREALATLETAVAWLQAQDDVETPQRAPQAAQGASQPMAAPGVHVCSVHGELRPSPKVPGMFFCPKRLADGSFCKTKFENGKLSDPYLAAGGH